MGLFQVFLIYFVLSTIFLYTNAHTADQNLSMNETKILEKTLVNEIIGNAQKVGRDNHLDIKERKEKRPLNLRLDSKGSLKELNSNLKQKHTQIPLNFVIDTKPRTIPIKIPLVIKTGNVKPALAHYKRLKDDTQKRKPSNHNSNKETPRKKILPIDIVMPKCSSNSSHKHKPKSSHFFEDDGNESVTPVSEPSNHTKQKKPTNDTDNQLDLKSEKVFNNEIIQRAYEIEPNSDSNETIYIGNGTHLISVNKLPEPIPSETESKTLNEEEVDEKLQENVSNDTSLTFTSEEIKELPTLKNEGVTSTIGVMSTEDDYQKNVNNPDKIMEPVKEHPIVTVDDGIDSSDIVTIKDYKYEECEERVSPTGYIEPINVSENINDPWTSQSLNNVYRNPYDNSFQNYQTAYNNYLNYIADNNLSIYNRGYFPCNDIFESTASKSAISKIVSYPETEEIQNIYGQRLETPNNIIDVRPENILGRVWRKWKNTEVEIRKPYYGSKGSYQLGGNGNTLNYGEFNGNTPAQYGPQAVGINGYYNNVNNAWPYSYANNRYTVRCL